MGNQVQLIPQTLPVYLRGCARSVEVLQSNKPHLLAAPGLGLPYPPSPCGPTAQKCLYSPYLYEAKF